MSQYTLLRGARQLLTLQGPDSVRSGSALQALNLIQDGSVLIKDGVIAQVGSTRRIENLKEAREAIEIDVNGGVVMPGFVDPSLRVTLRGGADGGGGKPKRMGKLYDETLTLLRSCLVNGTVVAELKGTAAMGDFRSDLSVLRRLAKIGSNPVEMVRTWQLTPLPETDDDVRDFCGILDRLSRNRLIHFVEVALPEHLCIGESLLRGLASANVGLKILWNGGGPDRLVQTIAELRPHSVFCSSGMTEAEAKALAGFKGPVVFAPGQDLGATALSGPRMAIDAGAAVALSTGYDEVASPAYSMQMAVSLASVYGQLSIEEAIHAATVNAAYAVGCGQVAGTLEAGKRADILVLDIPDYREIPRQFGINNVAMVLRNGAVVMNRSRWRINSHEPHAGRVRSQHL